MVLKISWKSVNLFPHFDFMLTLKSNSLFVEACSSTQQQKCLGSGLQHVINWPLASADVLCFTCSLLAPFSQCPRVIYAMHRMGCFQKVSPINPKTKTPLIATMSSGVVAGERWRHDCYANRQCDPPGKCEKERKCTIWRIIL